MRVIGIALLAAAALAQTASIPAFEVATVKASNPDEQHPLGRGFYTYPGGRVVASQCPLDYLLQLAFDIQPFQIAGAPGWAHSERFDIEAKPPASSESSKSTPNTPKLPPNSEQRQMLQALLIERFHLKYSLESKEGPVYLLVKTNRELKLREPKDKNDYPWVGSVGGGRISGDGLAGLNATMPLLAERLSSYLGRPVIDRTGIAGSYDFKIEYRGDDANPDLISTILTSVQSLGLKLETGRGPVKTLVIGSVEKPVGN